MGEVQICYFKNNSLQMLKYKFIINISTGTYTGRNINFDKFCSELELAGHIFWTYKVTSDLISTHCNTNLFCVENHTHQLMDSIFAPIITLAVYQYVCVPFLFKVYVTQYYHERNSVLLMAEKLLMIIWQLEG